MDQEKYNWRGRETGSHDAIYGLAVIGAIVYFIQHATSFWSGALGILKALVWPAILIYKLFEFLKV